MIVCGLTLYSAAPIHEARFTEGLFWTTAARHGSERDRWISAAKRRRPTDFSGHRPQSTPLAADRWRGAVKHGVDGGVMVGHPLIDEGTIGENGGQARLRMGIDGRRQQNACVAPGFLDTSDQARWGTVLAGRRRPISPRHGRFTDRLHVLEQQPPSLRILTAVCQHPMHTQEHRVVALLLHVR